MQSLSKKTFMKLLQQPHSRLAKLNDKVNHLHSLNQYLSNILDPTIAKYCQVANFESNILTIMVDSSSRATRIRYMIPDLIAKLKKHPPFHQLKSINCIIQLQNHPETIKKKKTLTLSEENKQLLQETAKSIKSKKLQKSLRQIVKSSERNTKGIP